jgi:hypothetical protein
MRKMEMKNVFGLPLVRWVSLAILLASLRSWAGGYTNLSIDHLSVP